MISWHRVGQKVVCVYDGAWWVTKEWWVFSICRRSKGPSDGNVVTVDDVVFQDGEIWFHFAEWPAPDVYPARAFRPVYPQAIEQLRRLNAPTPERERVKEDA